jgi:bla regulator protein blaR1
MISFWVRHLLESTFFCLLMIGVARGLRNGATARYAVWLMGIGKFAIPTVLLAKTGGEIASFWPAVSWISLWAGRISAALAAVLNLLPAGREVELYAIWAGGTIAMEAIWLARLRRIRRVLTLPTEKEHAAFIRTRAVLRVPLPIRLRCCDEAMEPALRGIWRPTITVPRGLSEKLTQAEFDSVILHELAHARRFDNLTNVFIHALVCLFWFHPLLWLVERRLNVERERACDETVVACGTTPDIYASGILKVCRFHLFEAAPGVSGMLGADLKSRLQLILDGPAPALRLLYVPWLLVAGLGIFMTLVPIAGGYCEQCASIGPGSSEMAPAFRCKAPAAACPQTVARGIQ